MKKFFLIALAVVGMMTANAQKAYEATNFGSNWSVGLDGGATTHLKGGPFFGDMRGIVGLHIEKQISPVFGLGVEGMWGINTSSWKMYGAGIPGNGGQCVFDNSYVGVYGTANLMNLFGGYNCAPRVFEIEATAGAGWTKMYGVYHANFNENGFGTKAGLNFNFNLCPSFTLALKPSVTWNMTGRPYAEGATASYDARRAQFNVMVGATYHFGPGFNCVEPADLDAIAALNAEVNALRAQLAGCNADLAASVAANAALAAELEACMNKKPAVVEKVNNNLETVRYIYFANASSAISADQQRTVDIIASYMKNHADSKLDVKGYASPEGNLEFNNKLAAARAEAVKNALVKKYKVAADRINAQGEGIGNMFSEPSWNRVAICTLDK